MAKVKITSPNGDHGVLEFDNFYTVDFVKGYIVGKYNLVLGDDFDFVCEGWAVPGEISISEFDGKTIDLVAVGVSV